MQAANQSLLTYGDNSGGLRYLILKSQSLDPTRIPHPIHPGGGFRTAALAGIVQIMDDQRDPKVFAFPSVQEQEQVQATLQSLAALRRNLPVSSRHSFETLIRRVLPHLPAYNAVQHLTPMEFILLSFIIELADDLHNPRIRGHPPLP